MPFDANLFFFFFYFILERLFETMITYKKQIEINYEAQFKIIKC